MFLKSFCCGPLATNCYLIACDETKLAAIIDAPLETAPLLKKTINQFELVPKMILLTHSHLDHIAEVGLLINEFNIPVYVHPSDNGNLNDPGSDGLPLFFPVSGVKSEHLLRDSEEIFIGNLKIEVIHTPGHSPGGVCFYLKKNAVLFSGDTLFQGTIGNLSFPTASPKEMWKSLKKLAMLPADTVVYPGHGEPTTIGAEAWIVEAEKLF